MKKVWKVELSGRTIWRAACSIWLSAASAKPRSPVTSLAQ
jgi:hypothetical protein